MDRWSKKAEHVNKFCCEKWRPCGTSEGPSWDGVIQKRFMNGVPLCSLRHSVNPPSRFLLSQWRPLSSSGGVDSSESKRLGRAFIVFWCELNGAQSIMNCQAKVRRKRPTRKIRWCWNVRWRCGVITPVLTYTNRCCCGVISGRHQCRSFMQHTPSISHTLRRREAYHS